MRWFAWFVGLFLIRLDAHLNWGDFSLKSFAIAVPGFFLLLWSAGFPGKRPA